MLLPATPSAGTSWASSGSEIVAPLDMKSGSGVRGFMVDGSVTLLIGFSMQIGISTWLRTISSLEQGIWPSYESFTKIGEVVLLAIYAICVTSVPELFRFERSLRPVLIGRPYTVYSADVIPSALVNPTGFF